MFIFVFIEGHFSNFLTYSLPISETKAQKAMPQQFYIFQENCDQSTAITNCEQSKRRTTVVVPGNCANAQQVLTHP